MIQVTPRVMDREFMNEYDGGYDLQMCLYVDQMGTQWKWVIHSDSDRNDRVCSHLHMVHCGSIHQVLQVNRYWALQHCCSWEQPWVSGMVVVKTNYTLW